MFSYTIIIPVFFISSFISVLICFIVGRKIDEERLMKERENGYYADEFFYLIEKFSGFVSKAVRPARIILGKIFANIYAKIIYSLGNTMEYVADYIRGKDMNKKQGKVSLYLEDLRDHKEKNQGVIHE